MLWPGEASRPHACMLPCMHLQLGRAPAAPRPPPQSAYAPSGEQRADRPAKRSLPASKADIVSTLLAMATLPSGEQHDPPRPSTNIKTRVEGPQWAQAATTAMDKGRKEALDDDEEVYGEPKHFD